MGFLEELLRAFAVNGGATARNVNVIQVQPAQLSSEILVRRRILPVWQERRWNRKGDVFVGFYRTRFGSYPGTIHRRYAGLHDFYIKDPPACLQNHSHAQCFISTGNDLFKVHFSKGGKTIDDGILAIEQILAEAHEVSG